MMTVRELIAALSEYDGFVLVALNPGLTGDDEYDFEVMGADLGVEDQERVVLW
jgi:hypothetical protein